MLLRWGEPIQRGRGVEMGVRRFAATLVLALCWGTACGQEKPPLYDPGTFSGMNEDAIRKDCQESLQCLAQMSVELPQDPMGECLRDSGEELENNSAKRDSFLRKFGRCMSFVVCDYYNCTLTDATGYGDTQLPQVMHQCQASIDCRLSMGTFTGERELAMTGCVATRTGTLNGFSIEQRQSYEAVYRSCMTFAGCEFTNCFDNAMPPAATMP
jgi:hypothetical protein